VVAKVVVPEQERVQEVLEVVLALGEVMEGELVLGEVLEAVLAQEQVVPV